MILDELVGVLGLKINEAQWAAGERAVHGLKEGLNGLGEKSGLGNLLKTGIAAFVGYEAINNVKEMVTSVTDLGASLNDTAQKTGLSVEALQFYGYVAKLNSSNTEEFSMATERLAKGLGELKHTGTGPAADGLKALGINFHAAAFKSATMDQKMQIIADHLSKLPDGAAKTAAAMDLFGRSGAQLIPTLNALGKHGAALRGEFEELGGGISGDNVKSLKSFDDEMDKTKYSLTALKNQIVIGMLPQLKQWVSGLQKWIIANKTMIAQKAEQVFKLIAGAVRLLVSAIGDAIKLMGWLSEHAIVAGAALGVLAAIFAPWELAIAAVAYTVKAFFDAFTEGKGPLAGFAKWFMGVIDDIKAALKSLQKLAGEVWDVISFIPKKIAGAGGAIKDFFGGGGDGKDPQNHPTTAQIFSGQAFQPAAPTATAPSDSYAASQAGSQQFNSPIIVNLASGDPATVQAAVKNAVRDAQKDMLRQAMAAVKGKS